MMYQNNPDGPFAEVPYALLHCWTAGGYTWSELEDARGLPSAVVSRLTPASRAWAAVATEAWPSLDAYERVKGSRECPVGRAWIGPAPHGIRLITGVPSAPIRTTSRGRWRWR